MEKKSGVESAGRSLPGSGGSQPMGEQFQPNLAMGGGSYKIPFDLPQGPGGFSPKFELNYNTGMGNGIFGMGWAPSLPFIQRKPGAYGSAETYSLAGADTLIQLDGNGNYIPSVQQVLQPFRFFNGSWSSVTPELVKMELGATANSRISVMENGKEIVAAWLLTKLVFPGNREINFIYEETGTQRYLKRITWSVFTLEFEYENREDVFSTYTAGIEIPTSRRCRRIALHHAVLNPDSLIRTYDFSYTATPYNKVSLLSAFAVTGWRMVSGTQTPTAMPVYRFNYTKWDTRDKKIAKFRSLVTPPPPLSDDTTVIDYKGTALPGILRMNGTEATYWENRGNGQWGPPQKLRGLPQGVHLADDNVRFADITGNGTADLVLASTGGGGYYHNDPGAGFTRKTNMPLAPGFDLNADDTWLVDLDGDHAADLLCFRNNQPMAFFNKNGQSWEGPVVLPNGPLNAMNARSPYTRFADMTGNGFPDLVQMISRRIVYYPFLGNGKWGAAKEMRNTPEFDLQNTNTGVYLADVDGDGLTDLVIATGQELRIYINGGGNFYSEPIIIGRAPHFDRQRFIITDMTGSGAAGFLWTAESSATNPHEYWYLDLLNGIKPNLLTQIENGRGLVTNIEYSTSVAERTRDLAKGYRWNGYLPFVVQIVKNIKVADTVTGDSQLTTYHYHEGNYDGVAREYMGFGMVESVKEANAHEAKVWQKNYYHHRGQTAFDPAFMAGKGQPHRMEILDPATGKVCQLDESRWEAVPIPVLNTTDKAWRCFEKSRRSRRFDNDVLYAEENFTYETDAIGNRTKELRTGTWTDSGGLSHTDVLQIDNRFAKHAVHGITSRQSQMRKTDGAGNLLKQISWYYDGAPFTGLPLGQIENGYCSRQTEIALTESQHVARAYKGNSTSLLPFYRVETDPLFGKVYVHDTRRYKTDAFGNQLELLDAVGHRVKYTFDTNNLHPVSYQHDSRPARRIVFDPVTQMAAESEDLNGQVTRTEYDAMGNVLRLYRNGAEPGKPTEIYTYSYGIPCKMVQQVRINAADAVPGTEKISYYDGNCRLVQEKVKMATGSYAVTKQDVVNAGGKKTGVRDAWISNNSAFEIPPATLAMQEIFYDFGGRIIQENLFNKTTLKYRYVKNETWFFNNRDVQLLAGNPAHIPTRISRQNAWGQVVSLVERNGAEVNEEKRAYDSLGQLMRITDPLGNTVTENIYDGWGNVIFTRSAEAGEITKVYDANNQLVLRTDADNRTMAYVRDILGRITEIREDGITGPVKETLTYDTGSGSNLAGRLAGVQSAFWRTEYSYDAKGKLTLARWHYNELPAPLEVRFSYNQQNEITRVQYPDGTVVNYDYFPTGLLQRIPGFINNIEYGPTGKRIKTTFANGHETRFTYTPGDYLLQELVTENAAHTIKFQHQVYTLDDVGQVTRIDDLANVTGKLRNNQTFTYDLQNRLTGATGRGAAGDYNFTYTYDRLGNLTFSGEAQAETLQYGHHTGDMLHPNRLIKRTAAAAPEYQYDASGNLTFDPAVGTLHYDKRHRVVRIDKRNGDVVEYDYDHNDRRNRARITSGGVTKTRYEVEGIWMQDETASTKLVFDEKKKLAVIPGSGDTLLHHTDRLGNVNIVTNLNTGAYVGQDEYTPFGQLSVSIALQPHFSFRGLEFSEGLDMVLMGSRFYRPRLGRFVSPDLYLIENNDKIPGLLTAINMYAYVYNNPVNGADPSGNIAFLVILIIAVVVGAIAGAIGAAVNGAQTWDEWLLWIIGGAIGGALVAVTGGGAIGWIAMAAGASFTTAALIGVVVFSVAALIGSWLTKVLDDTDSPVAWFFSFLIKWIQSPVLTTLGFLVAIGAAIGGSRWDFRRGMLFVEVSGGGALTLGAIAWTGTDEWTGPGGTVRDELALHESVHSKTVASIGEWGFYITYLAIAAPWGASQGGDWNDLNDMTGCGNPFEKTAHQFTDPGTPVCNP